MTRFFLLQADVEENEAVTVVTNDKGRKVTKKAKSYHYTFPKAPADARLLVSKDDKRLYALKGESPAEWQNDARVKELEREDAARIGKEMAEGFDLNAVVTE